MSKERILIVDDDPAIRDACFQVLTRAGYEADLAANPKEALDLISRYEFDAVLLDLKMPGMHGLELLKQIKEANPQVEVIIITKVSRLCVLEVSHARDKCLSMFLCYNQDLIH